MADNLISAALAGQPGTSETAPVEQQPAAQQTQPQVNYVTSEQLNAAMDEIKRTIQSSTDKSYNRVQKMIANMKQAGVQNPTYEQAQAMLAMQEQQSEAQNTEREAQPVQPSAANPEAEAWIRDHGGNPSQDFWMDIYDAAQEAGIEMITKEDPEYPKYFMEGDQLKSFDKPRHFVRAFEQALADKKERLSAQQGSMNRNLASSPALGAGGQKSSFIDPKTTNANSLITAGLKEPIRR